MQDLLIRDAKEHLKIWETFDFYGERDFTFTVARNEEEAILALAQSCGYATKFSTDEEKETELQKFFNDCDKPEVKEIKPENYDTLMFTDEDGVKRTFREQLNLMIDDNPVQFPAFFATTFEG